MLSNISVVGIKVETTQNTAATFSATDYVYALDVDVKPIIELLPVEYRTASLDKIASVVGQVYVEVSLTIPIKTSGTAGTALAPLGAALMACGKSETLVASTSVTYAPVSVAASANFFTLGKSCTIEYYIGQAANALKYVIKGCAGSSCVISGQAGKIGYYKFKFVGQYVALADASLPSVTYNTVAPKILQSATFTIQTYAAIMKSFEIDMGIKHAIRDDANSAYGVGGAMVVDRDPKGKFVVEAVPVATHGYIANLLSAAEGSCSFAVGSGAGYITTFTMPKTQYTKVDLDKDNEILKFSLETKFNKNAGDDWISIAQT